MTTLINVFVAERLFCSLSFQLIPNYLFLGSYDGAESWAANLGDNKISCDKPRDLFRGDFSLNGDFSSKWVALETLRQQTKTAF